MQDRTSCSVIVKIYSCALRAHGHSLEWIRAPKNPIPSLSFFHHGGQQAPKSELQALSLRCWKTSASRFEASRRMHRCSNASTLCVAMLSVEIIIINLLIFIPSLRLDGNLVTIVTIGLSAFVLVLSLIISQLKYDRREEDYHQCGLRLGELEKKINIFESFNQDITQEILEKFNDQYHAILRESNLNHTQIDWQQALKNTDEKGEEKYASKSKCRLGKLLSSGCLYIRWHFLRSDSVYNLLTLLGALIIVLIIIFGKGSDSTPSDKPVEEITIHYNL